MQNEKHIFLFLLLNSILAYLKLANVVQSAGTLVLLVIINCNALAIASVPYFRKTAVF